LSDDLSRVEQTWTSLQTTESETAARLPRTD
jgi:hypothetical protein